MTTKFGLTLALLITTILHLLNNRFPGIIHKQLTYVYIFQIGLFLALFLFWLFKNKSNVREIIKNIFLWFSIAFVILVGYSYQYELKKFSTKVLGNLIPSMAMDKEDGSVTFYTSRNGHFMIIAQINDKPIKFLLDTGATNVTLTSRDAIRLGIDIKVLEYNVRINTANGVSFVAPIRINQIKIGKILVRDVAAYISKNRLDISLLGMSFLQKLERYEVDKNSITLWN